MDSRRVTASVDDGGVLEKSWYETKVSHQLPPFLRLINYISGITDIFSAEGRRGLTTVGGPCMNVHRNYI